MAPSYGNVYRGVFGYVNSGRQPVIRVGRHVFPVWIDGLRSVVGTNGSTRFTRLDRRPAWNAFPPSGTPCVGRVAPPYSGHAGDLGPRMSEWGVDSQALVARQRHQGKGARRARSHHWRQMRQRTAFA